MMIDWWSQPHIGIVDTSWAPVVFLLLLDLYHSLICRLPRYNLRFRRVCWLFRFLFPSAILIYSIHFQLFQISSILFIIKPHLLAQQSQELKTFHVIWVFLVNSLVNSKSFLVVTDSPFARSNHQFPFDFLWLELTSLLQIKAGFLILILFHIVNTQPSVGINICR